MPVSLVTTGFIVGSICSSTAIIMMNKYVMDTYKFNSPTSLTAYHFLMTYALLEIMCRINLFQRASSVPQMPRWEMGVLSVGTVVLMNFNLKMNSVGFYQLSKLCTIPFMVVYKLVVQKQTTPIPILFSLVILLVGIALFTVNDVQFNIPGALVAVFGVTFTALQQIRTGTMQAEFNINGPQLQHATALQQFVLVLGLALVVETHGSHNIFAHHFVFTEMIIIFLTGIVSVGVNVFAFGIIGKTSPVTYQVVGHVKTILIFTFGLILFKANESETRLMFYKKVFGLLISMSGVILYTYLNLKGKEKTNSTSNKGKNADLEKLLSNEEEEEITDLHGKET